MPQNAPAEITNQTFRFPDYVDNRVLAGAAETVTPPSWARWVRIKVTDVVWVDKDATAVVPSADVEDGTGCFPIDPSDGWEVLPLTGVATFSIIGTATVALAYYGDEKI